MQSPNDASRSLGHVVAAFGVIAALFVSMGVNAETGTNAAPAGGPPSANAAFVAAVSACAASVSKDAHAGHDRAAMDECMKKKGFTPPQRTEGNRPPPGAKPGAPPGPPPLAPSSSSSISSGSSK